MRTQTCWKNQIVLKMALQQSLANGPYNAA